MLVTSKLFRRPFEFELTRSQHMKVLGTCSMVFRKAPQDQLLEAWRILRHASKNRTLFVDKVEQWHDSIRFKYGEQAQAVWEEPAPGSYGSQTAPGAGFAIPGSAIADADVDQQFAEARKKVRARSAAVSDPFPKTLPSLFPRC